MSNDKTYPNTGDLPIEQFAVLLNFLDGKTLVNIRRLSNDCKSLFENRYTLKHLIHSAFQKYFNYDLSWYTGEYDYDLLKALIILGEKIESSYGVANLILENSMLAIFKKNETLFEKLRDEIKSFSRLDCNQKNTPLNNSDDGFFEKRNCIINTIITEVPKFLKNDNLLPAITFLLSKAHASYQPQTQSTSLTAYSYGKLSYLLNSKIFLGPLTPNVITSLCNFFILNAIYKNEPPVELNGPLPGHVLEIFWIAKCYFFLKFKGFDKLNPDNANTENILTDLFGTMPDSSFSSALYHYGHLLTAYLIQLGEISETKYASRINRLQYFDHALFNIWLPPQSIFNLLDLLLEKYASLSNFSELKEMVEIFKQELTAGDEQTKNNHKMLFFKIFRAKAISQLEILFQKGFLLRLSNPENSNILAFFLDTENYALLKALNPRVFFRMVKKTVNLLFNKECKPYLLNFEEYHIKNLQNTNYYIHMNDTYCTANFAKFLKNFNVDFLFANVKQCQNLLDISRSIERGLDWNLIIELCKFYKELFNNLPSYRTILSLIILDAENIEVVKNFLQTTFLNKNLNTRIKTVIDDIMPELSIAIVLKNTFLDKLIEYLLSTHAPKTGVAKAILKANNDFIFNNLTWDETNKFSYNALVRLIQADSALQPEIVDELRNSENTPRTKANSHLKFDHHSSKVAQITTALKLKKTITDIKEYQPRYKTVKKALHNLKEDNNALKRKLAILEDKLHKKKQMRLEQSQDTKSDFFRRKPAKQEIDDTIEDTEKRDLRNSG